MFDYISYGPYKTLCRRYFKNGKFCLEVAFIRLVVEHLNFYFEGQRRRSGRSLLFTKHPMIISEKRPAGSPRI